MQRKASTTKIEFFNGELRDRIIGLAKGATPDYGVSEEAKKALSQSVAEGDISRYIHALNAIWNECCSSRINETTPSQCTLSSLVSLDSLIQRVNLLADYEREEKIHEENLRQTDLLPSIKKSEENRLRNKGKRDEGMMPQALSEADTIMLNQRIIQAKLFAVQQLKELIQETKKNPEHNESTWMDEVLKEFPMLAAENANPEEVWDAIYSRANVADKAITESHAKECARKFLQRYANQFISYETYKVNCQTMLPSGPSLTFCWGNGHKEYGDMQDAWVSDKVAIDSSLSSEEVRTILGKWVGNLQKNLLAAAITEEKLFSVTSLREGGATFVASAVYKDKIHTVNLGDSLAYVCVAKPNGEVVLRKLNEYQHTVTNAEERVRILSKALNALFAKELSQENLRVMLKLMQVKVEQYEDLHRKLVLLQEKSVENSAAMAAIRKQQSALLEGETGLAGMLCELAEVTYSRDMDSRIQKEVLDLEKSFQGFKQTPQGEFYPFSTFAGSHLTGCITAHARSIKLGSQGEAAYSVCDLQEMQIAETDRVFLLHMTDGVLKRINPSTVEEYEISDERLEEKIKNAVRTHRDHPNAAASIGKELALEAFNDGSGDNICNLVSEITRGDPSLRYQGVIDGNGSGGAGNKVAYLVADNADVELRQVLSEVMLKKELDQAAKQASTFFGRAHAFSTIFTPKHKVIFLPDVSSSKELTEKDVGALVSSYIHFYEASHTTLNKKRVKEARSLLASKESPESKLIQLLVQNITIVREESVGAKLRHYRYGEFHRAILEKWPQLADQVIAAYNGNPRHKHKIAAGDNLKVNAVKAWREQPKQQGNDVTPPSKPPSSKPV